MGTCEWSQIKLADVCDSIDYGYTASATPLLAGPKFLRITDIVQGHIAWHQVPFCTIEGRLIDRFRLHHGDIVIARTGATTGVSAYVAHPPDAVFASYLVRLRLKPGIDSRFVSYYLKSPQYWDYIRGVLGDKSAQPNASARTLTQAHLSLPPLAEQEAIARILGALDDKIELNRRTNETLEGIARAIFQSWFVDFDPVRAKAEGRQPAGMDAETAALFPSEFEDSEIGEIPRGWQTASLPDVVEINPPRSLRSGVMAPYLEMQNMPTRGHRAITWIDRPFNSGAKYLNGDTLLARITPCLENGKTAFVDFLPQDGIGWGSTEYIVLRPRPPLPPEYGYFLARSEALRDFAIRNMSGSSGRQRVPTSCLSQYTLACPSRKIAESFGVFVRPLMLLIKSQDEQSRTLAEIRDVLLPRLMSGELRVNDAERLVQSGVLT